eukprot:Plantae.Rhodophyta-Rhodochaete_pulchella.ctg8840.p1 GENE.Plantae.Rhodophyta-Rhodochaete_pulchella.ctg8840~~Plantae.Rhodophyta-Rhodochaete_pulchella.ctg8840.p1  ORF type:complete len:198 (+),score=16.86 Plantae.Rhodophyta-Rhodochaete_pulchella.ctg8840:123-716(+)
MVEPKENTQSDALSLRFADFRTRNDEGNDEKRGIAGGVDRQPSKPNPKGVGLLSDSYRKSQHGVFTSAPESLPVTAVPRMNKLVRRMKTTLPYDGAMRFVRLDISSIRLLVYSDSSFSDNEDLRTQIGYIVLLAERQVQHTALCVIQVQASQKIRLSCRDNCMPVGIQYCIFIRKAVGAIAWDYDPTPTLYGLQKPF